MSSMPHNEQPRIREEVLTGTLREVADKVQSLREDVIRIKADQDSMAANGFDRLAKVELAVGQLDVLMTRLRALEEGQGRARDIAYRVLQAVVLAAVAGGLGIAL